MRPIIVSVLVAVVVLAAGCGGTAGGVEGSSEGGGYVESDECRTVAVGLLEDAAAAARAGDRAAIDMRRELVAAAADGVDVCTSRTGSALADVGAAVDGLAAAAFACDVVRGWDQRARCGDLADAAVAVDEAVAGARVLVDAAG